MTTEIPRILKEAREHIHDSLFIIYKLLKEAPPHSPARQELQRIATRLALAIEEMIFYENDY